MTIKPEILGWVCMSIGLGLIGYRFGLDAFVGISMCFIGFVLL